MITAGRSVAPGVAFVGLAACCLAGMACGGHGLSEHGRDASRLNDPAATRDAAQSPDGPMEPRTPDLGQTGGSDGQGGGDDAGSDRDRDGLGATTLDVPGPDAVPAQEVGRGDAARDVAADLVVVSDLVDGLGAPDRGPDAMVGDARGDASARDVPVLVDALDDATGAVDVVPTLALVAGGVGGGGTQDGTGAAARFYFPCGVVSDGQGNLYVADLGNHAIRKVVVATGVTTTLAGKPQEAGFADGIGADARLAAPAGVTSDGRGNLYFTDSGTHLIRKLVIATGEVSTVAGVLGQSGSVDGIGTSAMFWTPHGIVYDNAGALYITDRGGHQVRKLVLDTGAVTTVAGSSGNPGNQDGIGGAAQFSAPEGLALDGSAALLVADTDNRSIRRIVLATGEVTTVDKTHFHAPAALIGDGHGSFYVTDASDMVLERLELSSGAVSVVAGEPGQGGAGDGTGTAARFNQLAGVALDGQGNALLADWGNNLIRAVVLASGAVTTVAGLSEQGGAQDGVGAQARFRIEHPAGMVSDGAGNLYLADSGNHTIRKIVIATAEVTTLAGAAGSCDMTDGAAGDARFCTPSALAWDGQGNLFVADSSNHTIRKIALASAQVSTVAGYPGAPGSADGSGAAARFHAPTGVAADGAGTVYVADLENDLIRAISLASGTVTTLAGAAGQEGPDDGVGAQARFIRPAALALDGAGALFVADSDGNTIRRIALGSATVSTLAGIAGNYGNEDGIGDAARLAGVAALAFDGAGNLFAADDFNRAVRKVTLATAEVTTVVGNHNRMGVIPGPLPASLTGPVGLAFVAPGTLFISDKENVVVRATF